LKPNLKEVDRRIIQVLLENKGPMTASFIAQELAVPTESICQRLGDPLSPLLVKSRAVVRDSSNRLYTAQSYQLRSPELVAQAIFGARICPAKVPLGQVE